jgi:cell division protein FtsI (penicillin-binding protein 3)
MRVGRKLIRDHRNYGAIDLPTLIKKSSNVGATKLALAMTPQNQWETLASVGFGIDSRSGFPGEATGTLSDYSGWHKLERATLSFGYGVSVTALQLARAYTVFANDGLLNPVTLVRKASHPPQLLPEPERVMSKQTARSVRSMLELVVGKGGTGVKASVKGYRVAGKTGTVKMSGQGGYLDDHYNAVFAGMAPASHPRLVMVVVINDPSGDAYYGGEVAAPVFSKVMGGALRILDIPPDDVESLGGASLALLTDKKEKIR